MWSRTRVAALTFTGLQTGFHRGRAPVWATSSPATATAGLAKACHTTEVLPAQLHATVLATCVRGADMEAAVRVLDQAPEPGMVVEQAWGQLPVTFWREVLALCDGVPSAEASSAVLVRTKLRAALHADTEVRNSVVRQVLTLSRYRHDGACGFLAELCDAAGPEHTPAVVELFDRAVASAAYVDASAFGPFLQLLLRSGRREEINARWKWMRHTRASHCSAARSALLSAVAATRTTGTVAAIVAAEHLMRRDRVPPTDAALAETIDALAEHKRSDWRLAGAMCTHWAPGNDLSNSPPRVLTALLSHATAHRRSDVVATVLPSLLKSAAFLRSEESALATALRAALLFPEAKASVQALLTIAQSVPSAPLLLGLRAAAAAAARDRAGLLAAGAELKSFGPDTLAATLDALLDGIAAADWRLGQLAVAELSRAVDAEPPTSALARLVLLRQASEGDGAALAASFAE